jgi:hypothetical protein
MIQILFGNLKTGQGFLDWRHVGVHYWSAGSDVTFRVRVMSVIATPARLFCGVWKVFYSVHCV